MATEQDTVLHNRDKRVDMSDTVVSEMQAIVRRAAEPWAPGDSVKVAISRAAHRLEIGYRRARTFWYGTSCAVRAVEADALRAADIRLLRDRRRALLSEAQAIEERIRAREGELHAADSLGLPAGSKILSVARQSVDRAVGMVREAGVSAKR